MARKLNRLSARKVAGPLPPGRYPDGANLILQVARGGSKSWLFSYQRDGRRHDVGLGGVTSVPLARAREKAAAARALLADGLDPLHERRGLLASRRGAKTFAQAAEGYIVAHSPGWRDGGKNAAQWRSALAAYAFPLVGGMPVGEVDQGHVLAILEPIWISRNETATRLRRRIENVLDFATAHKYRTGENPARWRGHLDKLLARPTLVRSVVHFAALPYVDVPAFLEKLRDEPGVAARALEFTVLTACRTGEVVGCRWSEIAGDVWTIPGSRMKAGKEYRVPLSPAAMAVLDAMRAGGKAGDLVFPGRRRGKTLSNTALPSVMERLGRGQYTVHGLRSSFRDWAGERTSFAREVCEAALAHSVGSATETAYARGDLLEKRRQLMDSWSRYCFSPPKAGEVVPIRAR